MAVFRRQHGVWGVFLLIYLLCSLFVSSSYGGEKTGLDSHYFQTQSDILYLKGEKAYYTNQKTRALLFFKHSLRYNPKAFHLFFRLAEIYVEEGLWAEGVAQYNLLLEKAPHLHKAHFRLAEIYQFQGLNQQALQHYEKLLKLRPKNFLYSFQYAQFLLQEKKWNRALKALNKAWKVALEPDDQVKVLLSQSFIYNELRFFKKQKKLLKKIWGLRPFQEALVLKVVHLLIKEGKLSQAQSFLSAYDSETVTYLKGVQTLADIFIASDQKEEAYKQLSKLQESGALKESYFFTWVALLIEKEKYVQAEGFLKNLLRDLNIQDKARYFLGALYEIQGRFSQALLEYEKVPSLSSYFVSSQIQMAQILQNQNQKPQALIALKKAAFLPSAQPQALLLYSQMLWENLKKTEAVVTLTKGLKLFPKNRDIFFLRGFYFSELKEFPQAIKDIGQVLVLDSQNEEAFHFMGDIYYQLKDFKKSQFFFEKAMLLTKDGQKVQEIQKKLSDLLSAS